MRGAALFFAICGLLLGPLGANVRAQTSSMFDAKRAEAALAAVQGKVGHGLRALSLTITPNDLSIEIASDGKPGETESWRVSHKGLAAELIGDIAVRERSGLYTAGSLKDAVFAIDPGGLAMVPKLVADAIARARLQSQASVTEMELRKLPDIIAPDRRGPFWNVHVVAPEEEADIGAKPDGELTVADLNRTKRARNLNLLAGGPDFDEMVQTIRSQIKNDWIFHYVEIEKTGIDFDVHLLGVKDPRITRFHATLSGVRTDNLSMPHLAFPGTPADDPFALSDVDFSLAPKIQQAAKERLAIADGEVQRVIVSKPHRENASAIEWEVDVRSAHAPLFWTPNQPPVEEGAVFFDAKGQFVRAKYPPGRGPQTHLLEPRDLARAIAKIAERLGPHAEIVELTISDDSLQINAADPRAPGKLAVFDYKDDDVVRAPEAMQGIAEVPGAKPDWRWDLAVIDSAAAQRIGEMEKRTLQKIGDRSASVERISITKDKTFHPNNDKVLVLIQPHRDSGDADEAAYEISGAEAKLGPARSGLFFGEPGGSQGNPQDEDDCTRSQDPQVIIPACTRMIEHNQADSSHDLAVIYFDRALAYKTLKQYDHALADSSQALKLDPKYAHAYFNRGVVLAATGDSAGALRDYSEAIRLDPSNALAYLNRGMIYHAEKNYDAAVADFGKTIALAPKASVAYVDRGWAYYSKGDVDRAIADYGEALRDDPANQFAYVDRALAYGRKGDIPHALADYSQVLKVNSNLASGYFGLGYNHFRTGDLPKALAELTQANALDPGDPYIALLLDIVAARSHLQSSLKDQSAKIDMTKWPAPVIRLYLGQLTPDAVLAAADNADATIKRGRVCEVDFYTGELDLRDGRKDDARQRFEQAARDCPPHFLESWFAASELHGLEPTTAKPTHVQ
jgi:tetratricopeptide (TPR) repeat protein